MKITDKASIFYYCQNDALLSTFNDLIQRTYIMNETSTVQLIRTYQKSLLMNEFDINGVSIWWVLFNLGDYKNKISEMEDK